MTAYTDAQAQLVGEINMTGLPYQSSLTVEGFNIPPHTHVTLDPPALPTTITYRQGGPTGPVVAVLNLTYSGTDLATIWRVA